MVNTEDFVKRLETILDYYSLNASSFADKIGVQRSSLSHLMSGRNKPSLDFILKITEVFPEVDLYWLLNGKGSFPKSIQEKEMVSADKFSSTPTLQKNIETVENLFSEEEKSPNIKNEPEVFPIQKMNEAEINEVEKIVVFYTNGTFSEYAPKKINV